MAKAKDSGRFGSLTDNFVFRYLRQTRAELRKVVWPSREETVRLSGIVIAVTVAMSVFLGLMDFVFARLASLIIG